MRRAPRDVSDYLRDMSEYAEKACRLVGDLDYPAFAQDDRTHLAVPTGFRSSHPQVPWAEAAGIRDVLIHDYFGVNLEVVWKTVQGDLPLLRTALLPLLRP